ncbi:hypothetical protein BKA82DRAFT_4234296 [Pisolithus tinctorius]|nr:hypothetical protein BKA82DRAFT_4234296 [Pisolithus tinctorius]
MSRPWTESIRSLLPFWAFLAPSFLSSLHYQQTPYIRVFFRKSGWSVHASTTEPKHVGKGRARRTPTVDTAGQQYFLQL